MKKILQFKFPWTLGKRYHSLDLKEPPITVCLGVAQVWSKVGVTWMWSPIDNNLSGLR